MDLFEPAKKDLDEFCRDGPHGHFGQSWEWGEFQKAAGKKIRRIGFKEGGLSAFIATLVFSPLPGGKTYAYSPRPDLSGFGPERLKYIFTALEKAIREEEGLFFRFDPVNKFSMQGTGYRLRRTIPVQPPKTLLLDIGQSEKELLEQMHPKTRYNIRLAKRKGVRVRAAGENDFDAWWKLMRNTRQRDGFRTHVREYYRSMLGIPFVKLLLADYQGQIIAGNIVGFYGNTATYIHGASGNEHRNVMAPFLLQWQAIRSAKKLGLGYYDFYGIDRDKWPGVTRFKMGFGGQVVDYPGTFDVVFNKWWYGVYKLARGIRRKI